METLKTLNKTFSLKPGTAVNITKYAIINSLPESTLVNKILEEVFVRYSAGDLKTLLAPKGLLKLNKAKKLIEN